MTTRTIATAATLLAALALAACGSSGDDDGSASTAAANGGEMRVARADAGDVERLRACIAERGGDLPERPRLSEGAPGDGPPPEGATAPAGPPPEGARMAPFGGEDLSDAERERLEAAFEACGGRRPSMRGAQPRRADSAALRSYVACVRRNGYDLPDPDTSGDGPVFDAAEVDRDDPAFVSASRACERLLAPPARTGADDDAEAAAG